jgi:hypothetical protein
MHFVIARQIRDWTHAAVALPSALDPLYGRLVENKRYFFFTAEERKITYSSPGTEARPFHSYVVTLLTQKYHS